MTNCLADILQSPSTLQLKIKMLNHFEAMDHLKNCAESGEKVFYNLYKYYKGGLRKGEVAYCLLT